MMTITLFIIIGTVGISFMAWNNRQMFDKYKFNAYMVFHKKEWARMLTHGFLHADYLHLAMNMIVLWSFGSTVELFFRILQAQDIIMFWQIHFILLYFGGMVAATLISLYKYKNASYYNAVGASGAVAAVSFTYIFYAPFEKILLFGILPMPALLFGIAYLAYSYYAAKRSNDNIAHEAHFAGAVYGIIYPLIISPTAFNIVDKFSSF